MSTVSGAQSQQRRALISIGTYADISKITSGGQTDVGSLQPTRNPSFWPPKSHISIQEYSSSLIYLI